MRTDNICRNNGYKVSRYKPTNLKAQGATNRINTKKSTPRHILIKLLKTKYKKKKKKTCKKPEEKYTLLEETNSNSCGFLIRNLGGQWEVKQHF